MTPADLLLEAIPYARLLGLRSERAGDELTVIMPFADNLIGNPLLPALHGGATAAFMEMTATAQLAILEPRPRLPRPINVTVAYLRSGKPVDTFARARINKAGKRIANVHVEAWQETRGQPIALLNAHFLLDDLET